MLYPTWERLRVTTRKSDVFGRQMFRDFAGAVGHAPPIFGITGKTFAGQARK
jgi:hypothetical protein